MGTPALRSSILTIPTLLLACVGCGNQPVAPSVAAALAVRVVSPPALRNQVVFLPNISAPQSLWFVDYEIEIRETQCVAVNLTFAQIQILVEDFGVSVPAIPFVYDQAALVRQGLSQLAPCQAGHIFSGSFGSINSATGPKGPVRVMVRAIGADEHGHGIGIDTGVESPLQVTP